MILHSGTRMTVAPVAASAKFPLIATSTKRPHWVALGFDSSLRRCSKPIPVKHVVHGAPLVSFVDDRGELHVAKDACPHMGASLAGGSVRGGCLVCPYHSLAIDTMTHPAQFYNHAVLQGMVWLDYARDVFTQHHMPPVFPELSSRAYKVWEGTYPVDANPVVLMDHLVHWPLVTLPGCPLIGDLVSTAGGHRGAWTRVHDAPSHEATLEHEYHAPFTASVRLLVTHKASGVVEVPLLVCLSVSPHTSSKSTIHARIAHSASPAPVPYVSNIVELLTGQGNVSFKSIEAHTWSRHRLGDTPRDGCVAAYRTAMEDLFPEVLEAYVL